MVTFAQTRERDNKGKFIKPTISSGFDKLAYFKEYYRKNKKKRLKQSLEWARNNKERRKVIKDRWRAKNRGRTNFLTRLYIYRRKNALGKITFEEVEELYRKFPVCVYCKVNKSNSIDHKIPLSKGGTNNIDNLIPACISCNSKKGNKIYAES